MTEPLTPRQSLSPDTIRALCYPPGSVDGPEDECDCGDYRSDHENGIGPCRFRSHGVPDNELNRCTRFRLAGRAGWRERIQEARNA